MLRTHTCGELSTEYLNQSVTLSGWVKRRRDHGGLIFIDLRDQYGITQVVFNPKVSTKSYDVAKSLRSEFVIQITGIVESRPTDSENSDLLTGEIEVSANEIEILNTSKTPPFEPAT